MIISRKFNKFSAPISKEREIKTLISSKINFY